MAPRTYSCNSQGIEHRIQARSLIEAIYKFFGDNQARIQSTLTTAKVETEIGSFEIEEITKS